MILATGGAAALWPRTTNPPGSLGIGLLLARGAGAALADLELMQFHPTAVTGVKGREGFLVTEAIRGEGATLLDADGERFVDELAPRDEVARAIWSSDGPRPARRQRRPRHARGRPGAVPQRRRARCARRGSTRRRELVPVAPAAHYVMGGIVADLDGATTVPGLYAVGESACTGLHGANRLASNSLSECFVFGARAALAALDEPRRRRAGRAAAPRRAARAPAPRDARRAVARTPASSATREGLERAAPTTRTRSRASIAAPRAAARGEPRRALPRATSRRPTPRSTATTPSPAATPTSPRSSAGPERETPPVW